MIKNSIEVGLEGINTKGQRFRIVGRNGNRISVKFVDTGSYRTVTCGSVRKGSVTDFSLKK